MYWPRRDLPDLRKLASFNGSVDIGSLEVQLLDEETKNTLKVTGKEFVLLTRQDHYHREYDGFMIQRTDQDVSSGSSTAFALRARQLSRVAPDDSELVHFQVSHFHDT
jgi:hypothetical protein